MIINHTFNYYKTTIDFHDTGFETPHRPSNYPIPNGNQKFVVLRPGLVTWIDDSSDISFSLFSCSCNRTLFSSFF